MPQLLLLAAIGVGAYLGVRWLRNKTDEWQREEARKVAAAQQAAESAPVEPGRKNVPTLVQDPQTGVYRVDED